MRDKVTQREVGKHIARFILVGLYTGTRHAAICGAAFARPSGAATSISITVFFTGAPKVCVRRRSASRPCGYRIGCSHTCDDGTGSESQRTLLSSGTGGRCIPSARASPPP